MIKLETSMGDILIELFEEQAPKSCANILEYVNAGHYDGTVFHRVINGFILNCRAVCSKSPLRTGESIEVV